VPGTGRRLLQASSALSRHGRGRAFVIISSGWAARRSSPGRSRQSSTPYTLRLLGHALAGVQGRRGKSFAVRATKGLHTTRNAASSISASRLARVRLIRLEVGSTVRWRPTNGPRRGGCLAARALAVYLVAFSYPVEPRPFPSPWQRHGRTSRTA
jgi:hypothetical protein